jgi:hypothetical protein
MGIKLMSPALWTVLSLIAYVAGVGVILNVTPRLYRLAFDEGLFMAIAAADVFGAIFAFGAVGITFAAFNGVFAIRLLDFFLLVGIFIISIRMTLRSLRPPKMGETFRLSRVLVGCFGIFLLLASFLSLVFLFKPIG